MNAHDRHRTGQFGKEESKMLCNNYNRIAEAFKSSIQGHIDNFKLKYDDIKTYLDDKRQKQMLATIGAVIIGGIIKGASFLIQNRREKAIKTNIDLLHKQIGPSS